MLILFGNQPKLRGYIWLDAILEATEKIARFSSSGGHFAREGFSSGKGVVRLTSI